MPEEVKPKRAKTEDPAVTKFREYIRIKTVHPNPDYDSAIAFLKKYAEEIGIPCRIVELESGLQIVIMTLVGQQPDLTSVVLNSHTDVVPVFPEKWKCDPFAAEKFENGDIYGRGTQDMKASSIQYLESARRIIQSKVKLHRTLHLTFVPDEEIGGVKGMQLFVQHEEFKKLNVGFVIDEGLANPTDAFTVFYGERAPWWLRVKCTGNPGHGSRFIENTAAEKFRTVINKFLDFRAQEEKKLKGNSCLRLGDVTTVNLTHIEGGVAMNVVPMDLYAGFDIRVTPTVQMDELEKKIKQWCTEAGNDVTYEFLQKCTVQQMTSIAEEDKWWSAFSKACRDMGMKIETEIFPAATDSRFLREIGLPAIGFSPMNNTPILLHDHNEFHNEQVFLAGIDIFYHIIVCLADVAE